MPTHICKIHVQSHLKSSLNGTCYSIITLKPVEWYFTEILKISWLKGWISQKVDREWLLGVSCKRLGKQNWKGKTKWRWGLIIYFLRIINMPHHLTQRLCPSEMASWPTARTLCFIRRWIRFQLGSFRPATNSYIFLFYPKYLYVIFKWQILWSLHKEGLLCHWYSEGVKWGC